MLFRDQIDLITTKNTLDVYGDAVETVVKRTVFANKLQVSQTEFYQAAQTELKPSLKFKIRSVEYQGELFIEYKSIRYDVIREFDKSGEFVELTCSKST